MNLNAIQSWLEQASADLLAKGYDLPRGSFTLRDSGAMDMWIAADIPYDARSSDSYSDGYVSETIYSADLDTLFGRAADWITKLEAPENMALRKFQRDLATIIDKANTLGLDANLVNPLTELSKQLSENAITKQ